jgi:histidinol-phosphate aminotransferase
MVTNGTDQAIDVIFRTFSESGDRLVIPEPTFSMYAQYARVNGNRLISPLYSGEELSYPLAQVLEAAGSAKIIVVCNPNNPTGTLVSANDIARIAARAENSMVYVDEAYFEFSGVTAVGLIEKYPNVIVSRTFSKAFGLAGLRIGYVVARREYIAEMLKVRGPYDVNRPAVLAAAAALKDSKDTKDYAREVMREAKPLVESFFKRSGIKYYASAGNFLLFAPENSEAVARELYQHGVAVRPQHKPGVTGCLRLTVGTTSQMEKFIDIYEGMLAAPVKYAFIDRDGTLIDEPQDTFQVDSLERLRLLDGAAEGLKRLQALGYRLVLVSNQNGVGRPSFPQQAFDVPQQAMLDTFKRAGVTFEKVFVCPHLPEDNCDCRKPKTGLVDGWLEGVKIDKKQSFVCGDRQTDKQFADNLGIGFVPMTTNGNFLDAISKLDKQRRKP